MSQPKKRTPKSGTALAAISASAEALYLIVGKHPAKPDSRKMVHWLSFNEANQTG